MRRGLGPPACPQVCGILLVLVGGGHMVLWWGLYCHPAARATFALLYYGCAAGCVWAALRARTAAGRGLPMLALLLVRISAFAARLLLEPPSVALQHFAAMEVGAGAGAGVGRVRAHCARAPAPHGGLARVARRSAATVG